MNISKNLLVFLILACSITSAETTLSGKIGGMTLDNTGSPYKVTADLHVEEGKTLTLKPGCVLLFKPFSSLIVDGNLIVEGTKEKPVVLTSINDGQYNDSASGQPQPFDWNGVTITREAETVNLTNFLLCYSVYGVKFQTDKVMISNGVFHSNGQFSVTIKDKILNVTENFPFTYNTDPKIKDRATRKPARSLKVASVCAGATGVICAMVSAPFWINAAKANRDGNNFHLQADIDAARARESTATVKAGVLTGAAGLLLPTSIVLFMLDKHKNAKPEKVSISPAFNNDGAGIFLTFHF